MAFVIGGLFAAGLYMMLSRSLVRLLIGLGLLSNAEDPPHARLEQATL